MRDKRFPGKKAFSAHEQHLFHGRDTEVEHLLAQVKVKNLLVLFSEPGMGKSSLVNAGLSPWLVMNGYQPIPVRVQDLTTSPVEAAKQALERYLDKSLLLEMTGTKPDEAGLWETCRSSNFHRFGTPMVPVLIFDQFEEFFEHAASAQQELAAELGDMVGRRLPCRVKEMLRETPAGERTSSLENWCHPFDVRILIAINSHEFGWLDDLKHEIPSILSNRYRLRALTRQQAEMAMNGPAAICQPDMDCPPFQFHGAAVQAILDELADERTGTVIDPFRLQLVLDHLEQVIACGKIPLHGQVLKAASFGGREGIRALLEAGFCENPRPNASHSSSVVKVPTAR